MMIYEALADLGVPVCHPPYKGGEETYITYQLLGQSGQIYAEGGEAETGVQYAVSIFAEGFAAGLLKRVKPRWRQQATSRPSTWKPTTRKQAARR